MTKVLLINEATIKKYSILNDNVDSAYILPAIEMAQNVDLDTLIGTVLCDKLKELVANGEISNPTNVKYKTLLDDYVTDYLVWQTISQVQIFINYKMVNSGMIENNDDKKSRLGYSDSNALKTQFEHYASSYANKLTNYLLKNVQMYPEYTKSHNYQYSMDSRLCDIYLENIPAINRRKYIGK